MSPARIEIAEWLTTLVSVRVEDGQTITIPDVKPPLVVSVDTRGERTTATCDAFWPSTIVDSSRDYQGVGCRATLTIGGVKRKGLKVVLSLL